MTALYGPRASVNGALVTGLTVTASLATAWRTATIDGAAVTGAVTATAGYRDRTWPVFAGAIDDAGITVQGEARATARGLTAWRAEVGPQGFEDVALETVLAWIAARCGGTANVAVSGERARQFELRRASAHRLVRDALAAWRVDASLIELDDGTLFVGPEASSPHATAGAQARLERGVNLIEFLDDGRGRYRALTPAMPWLRVAHRVTVTHPRYSGTARIEEVKLTMTRAPTLDTTTALRLVAV